MCILQNQSVTSLFLLFYYPHKLESGNTYNRVVIYTSRFAYIEKNKFKIETNTKVLTGSAKYTENRWPKIILKN